MRHVLFLALLLATALPIPGQAQEGGDKLSLEALTATPPGGGEARHSYAHHSYARPSYARHGYIRHGYRGGSRRHGHAPMHVPSRRGAARHAGHAVIHPRRHR